MRSDRNIWIAFFLNFLFSVVELIGGLFTGSVAIISDALHDFGDASAIAVSAILERKSKQPPNDKFTYGFGRFSVLGGAMNSMILLIGSVVVVIGAVSRLVNPSPIHYDGMLVMAVFGVFVNSLAAFITHGGHSANQKTVNLHMLEDVLGWIVVLVGAVVMRFTDWWFIDPIMSIGVAVFIFIHAMKHMAEILSVLLEKAPAKIKVDELQIQISKIPGVMDVHHIHLWTLDGDTMLATMHIVTADDLHIIKASIRHLCEHHDIHHITIEAETPGEHCHVKECTIQSHHQAGCHHHHHHHHHHQHA